MSSNGNALTVVTGGCGFIGTNVAHRELRAGHRVRVFDNLSRAGVDHNLAWLRSTHGDRLEVVQGDVRDRAAIDAALKGATRVYHFAAQVAVTTSIDEPSRDFEINGVGTFNLLESLRQMPTRPTLLFTSTNKVYGDLGNLGLRRTLSRYEPADAEVRQLGVSERQPLDFHSPYGCSKGLADQYVLDYARTYGVPAAVFRMSCIYGPHQFGNEDQGWVAHFLIKALQGQPITLFGDGHQVRDILYVEDLVDAMVLAQEAMDSASSGTGPVAGNAFNIGGGIGNTTSLVELLDLIGIITGRTVEYSLCDWRVGDQRYYVSDIGRFHRATGWMPRVNVQAGVSQLAQWLLNESPLLTGVRPTAALIGGDHGANVSVR